MINNNLKEESKGILYRYLEGKKEILATYFVLALEIQERSCMLSETEIEEICLSVRSKER